MAPQTEKFPEIKLVVSDFHLGTGRKHRNGATNHLEDFLFDEEFAEFLDYHCSGRYAQMDVELVLNGDILNLIQIEDHGIHTHLLTERATCRALRRIVAGHTVFFEALGRFAQAPGRRVTYVIGNHDAGMLWPAPQRVFEEAVGGRVRFYAVHCLTHGVHIEHGQQHEELARLDMERPFLTDGLPEPVLNLPWGSLFVSVLLSRIKRERPHVDKVKPFTGFLRYALLHDTIWAVSTVIRISWFIWETVMFKSEYHVRSGVRATWRMIRELTVYPDFDHAAERILERNPSIQAVIFGHTHVLRYRRFEDGRLYVNEGSWNEATHLELGDFGTQVRLTYAQVSIEEERPRIELKRWMGVWKPERNVHA